MGSLTSRPKLPSVQQPMVISVPTSMPAPAMPMPSEAQEDGAANDNPAKQRATSLLNRDRGRLGTIMTGFRGLLSPNSGTGRKTLLGE